MTFSNFVRRTNFIGSPFAGTPIQNFAALDEITRGRLDDDLRRIWLEQALTVVFVTHSVYESIYLSSRVVLFSARPGRIVASIDVDAPGLRDESFRADPYYTERCLQASAALRAASAS